MKKLFKKSLGQRSFICDETERAALHRKQDCSTLSCVRKKSVLESLKMIGIRRLLRRSKDLRTLLFVSLLHSWTKGQATPATILSLAAVSQFEFCRNFLLFSFGHFRPHKKYSVTPNLVQVVRLRIPKFLSERRKVAA